MLLGLPWDHKNGFCAYFVRFYDTQRAVMLHGSLNTIGCCVGYRDRLRTTMGALWFQGLFLGPSMCFDGYRIMLRSTNMATRVG